MTLAGRLRRKSRRQIASGWRRHKLEVALAERLAAGRQSIRLHGATLPAYAGTQPTLDGVTISVRNEFIMQGFEDALRIVRQRRGEQ